VSVLPQNSTGRSPSGSWRAAGIAGLLAVVLAACGGGGDGGAVSAPQAPGGGGAIPDVTAVVAGVQKDPQLAAMLPPPIAQAGSLALGSNLQSAPNNFYAADGTTPIGSLITSLQSGRVDLTMAAMNDTAERQKQIDFVDYFTSGITIMVRKGNPDGITGPDTLCGKTVALVQGTSHQEFATEQSAKCIQSGQAQITITATDSDTQNQNQLRTGRVAAILNDLPSAVYIARTAGDGNFFEVVPGEPINGGPYGIGVNKTNTQLTEAVRGALQALITDGTYGKILDAWGVQQGAVQQAGTNGGS
jgi:polar amino acid transport system substrate-binding protein